VRLTFQNITATRSNTHSATKTSRGNIGGNVRGKANGGENERAAVVSVTVAVAAFFPSRVTDDGETVHRAAVGAPVQVQVTA
jgi:hypothetical protein